MRAVIYARFSCSKQREESIEDQLRICREWCEREGYEVVAEYADNAISGRTDDRPEFQRMIANAGESDIVLVYMMDRFSRDPYDAPIYKKRLAKNGVRVVSATEPIIDTAEGILVEKIYEGLAAVESEHISKRTKRGMEGNAMKCRHNGVPVFGYRFADDGGYEVEPFEADIVRECFTRRMNGEAVNHIARDLAGRGIKTSYGNPASSTFVTHILRNRKYTGVYSWGDVEIEGGMPQIVDGVTFASVQHVRGRKVRADETWRVYPLSGGKGRCGCGGHLVGISTKKGERRYYYYRCPKCGARTRADWIEGEVVRCVRAFLADRENALSIARSVAEFARGDYDRLKGAEDRLRKHQRELANLLKAVQEGLPMDLARPNLDQLRDDIASAEHDIDVYTVTDVLDVDDFADFLQFGANLDDAAVLDTLVSSVSLGENVTVILAYPKGEPAVFAARKEPTPSAEVGSELTWLPGCHLMLIGRAVALTFPRRCTMA